MGKKLYQDLRAEHEADEVGARFMDSTDVVGDMSRAFGHDFSGVNIHADSIGASRVAGTGVDAIAEGNDIYFGSGYRKGDPVSNGLLAHELTHTMQQGAVGGGTGAQVSSPMGAAQGGMFDWFKKIFSRKKKPEPKMEISGPTDMHIDHSEKSDEYMKAMRNAGLSVGFSVGDLAHRMPEIHDSQLGGADTLQAYRDAAEIGDGLTGIKESNKAYREYMNKNDKDTALIQGLDGVGIRRSSNNTAIKDKAYMGNLMTNYYDSHSKYLQNLEAGGVNLEEVRKHGVRTQHGPGFAISGGEYDQMNSDMMNMFFQYAGSDTGVEYFKNAMDIWKNAEVFGGDKMAELNYLVKAMLNRAGGSYTHVSVNEKDKFEDHDSARDISRQIGGSLMAMPGLMGKDTSGMEKGTQRLVAQYTMQINDLMKKVQALTGKKA